MIREYIPTLLTFYAQFFIQWIQKQHYLVSAFFQGGSQVSMPLSRMRALAELGFFGNTTCLTQHRHSWFQQHSQSSINMGVHDNSSYYIKQPCQPQYPYTSWQCSQHQPLADHTFSYIKQHSQPRPSCTWQQPQRQPLLHLSQKQWNANTYQNKSKHPTLSTYQNKSKHPTLTSALLQPLFGTAIFTNSGHKGETKDRVRSKLAAVIVNEVTEKVINMDPEKKSRWQIPELFTVTTELKNELESFQQHVQDILGMNYRKYTFNGLKQADLIQSDHVKINTANDGITVLTVEMAILQFWETFDHDVKELYELFSSMIDARERKGALMGCMGIRQIGLGGSDNCEPILLQIKPHEKYNEFLAKAAIYYGKQQILEKIVAPTNCNHRFEIRDMHGDPQGIQCCCAIPGFEDFLGALSVSMTKDYYPDLHKDQPQEGSLECILFSSHTDAVFTASHCKQQFFISLEQPKLILLDSKQVLHGSQPTIKQAKKALVKAHHYSQSPRNWEYMFNKLLAYKDKHGDCHVPQPWRQDPILGRVSTIKPSPLSLSFCIFYFSILHLSSMNY